MKRGMTALAVMMVVGLLAGGCGAAREANEARKAVGDIKDAAENIESGSTGDKKLDEILARAEKAQTSTFKATYEIRNAGSDSTTTLVLAQKDEKSKWEVSEDDSSRTVFLDDGTDSYTCFPTGEGADLQCTKGEGSGGQGSLASAAAVFSPAVMLASVRGILPFVGASLTVDHFSDTKGGEKVDCVRFEFKDSDDSTDDEGPQVFCITKGGIWAYSESANGDVVELVDVSSSVSDDEFDVPGKVIDPSSYPDPDSSDE